MYYCPFYSSITYVIYFFYRTRNLLRLTLFHLHFYFGYIKGIVFIISGMKKKINKIGQKIVLFFFNITEKSILQIKNSRQQIKNIGHKIILSILLNGISTTIKLIILCISNMLTILIIKILKLILLLRILLTLYICIHIFLLFTFNCIYLPLTIITGVCIKVTFLGILIKIIEKK